MPKRPKPIRHLSTTATVLVDQITRYASGLGRKWSAVLLATSLGALACAAPEEPEYTPPVNHGGAFAGGGTSGTAGTNAAGTTTAGGSSGNGASGGDSGSTAASGGTGGGTAGKGGAGGTPAGGAAGKSGAGGTSGAAGASGTSGSSNSAGTGAGRGGSGGSPTGDLPFFDDFEDGDAEGWMSVDDEGAPIDGWSIVMDGSNVFKQGSASSDPSWSIGGNVGWTDQVVQVKLKFDDVPDESSMALIAARFSSFDSYYYLELRGDGGVKIRKRLDGSTTDVTRFDPPEDAPLAGGTWYTAGIGAVGSTLTAYFNGAAVATGTDSDITSGGIGVGTADEAVVAFDDVSVTEQ